MELIEKAKISDLLLRILKGELTISADDLMKRGNTGRVIDCLHAILCQEAIAVRVILSEKDASGRQEVLFGNSLFAFILAHIIRAYEGKRFNGYPKGAIKWRSDEFKRLCSTLDMSEGVSVVATTYYLNLHTLEISKDYAFTEGKGTWYKMERLFSLYREEDITDNKLRELAKYANILFDFEVDIRVMEKQECDGNSGEYFFHF